MTLNMENPLVAYLSQPPKEDQARQEADREHELVMEVAAKARELSLALDSMGVWWSEAKDLRDVADRLERNEKRVTR